MGSWGPGIFDDDLAVDIRAEFERQIAAGEDVKTAALSVLKRFASAVEDIDERLVLYLALAALQLEHRFLQPEIKSKALSIIKTGQGLEGWNEVLTNWSGLIERKQALEDLRAQLIRSPTQ